MMKRKIGIIGVGHVGAHCALTLCLQGACDELILVDILEQKAVSEALDLRDCMKYLPHRVDIRAGTYADVRDCDIVVISVGVHKKSGSEDIHHKNRLQGLAEKAGMVDRFIPDIVEAGFKGIFIVITNPCDIIAYHIMKISGFDRSRVFATGTMLDSMRFCQALSRETGHDPQKITGYTMGEHGDSQIAVWSQVSIDGTPLSSAGSAIDPERIINEVRGQAWNIADGKGATEFGISVALSKIVQSIYGDKKVIYPLSTLLMGQYGVVDLFASTPCVLGRNGIEQVIEVRLTDEELRGFQNSCEVIKKNIQSIDPG